jgi:hypothetical protein
MSIGCAAGSVDLIFLGGKRPKSLSECVTVSVEEVEGGE